MPNGALASSEVPQDSDAAVADLGGGAKGARAPPFKVADFLRDEPPMRATGMSTSRRLTRLHALICTCLDCICT